MCKAQKCSKHGPRSMGDKEAKNMGLGGLGKDPGIYKWPRLNVFSGLDGKITKWRPITPGHFFKKAQSESRALNSNFSSRATLLDNQVMGIHGPSRLSQFT